MKLTTGIVISILAAGSALAQQSGPVLTNVQKQLNASQQPKMAAVNDALAGSQGTVNKSANPANPVSKTVNINIAPSATGNLKSAKVNPASPSPSTNPAGSAKMIQATNSATVKNGSKAASKVVPAATKNLAETQRTAENKPLEAKPEVAVQDSKVAAETKSSAKQYNFTGHRDPFVSPVVNRATGSGCSMGKRCLAIDQINVRGVVKSDAGMIAVVTNSLDKAYFLRENDPVFNGYVVKITGDSVIFKESFEDKLGKTLSREITKKLTTPVV